MLWTPMNLTNYFVAFLLAGGWHISKRCMQYFGHNKRLTANRSHKYWLLSTASFIEFKTSNDVASSARHMEWPRWASGKWVFSINRFVCFSFFFHFFILFWKDRNRIGCWTPISFNICMSHIAPAKLWRQSTNEISMRTCNISRCIR